MKQIIKFVTLLVFLSLLNGCYGDPAAFVRDEKNIPHTDVIVQEPAQTEESTVITPTSLSSNTIMVKIEREVPINRVYTAIGYKDGVKDVKKEKVDLKFIQLDARMSLLVIHHISGDYTVSAEFTVENNWDEVVTINGSKLTTTVIWPDQTHQPLTLVYSGSKLSEITLKGRTFYLDRLPSAVTYSSEGNRGEHIVSRGENLKLIAKRYNTTVEELLRLNEKLKSNPNNIQPGMGIKFEK